MSIQILQPVAIKARVTDGLKASLTGEIQDAIKVLDEEMQELETQVKRAQLTATINPQQLLQFRQLVEAERAKRNDKKAQLQEELQAVQGLALGSEILRGTGQSIATIDVGTEFDVHTALEVVVEDGKVVAIRKGEA